MNIEKNPRGNKRIEIPINIEELKPITEMNDFFVLTGIRKYLDNGTIFDVRQMEMNQDPRNKLTQICELTHIFVN